MSATLFFFPPREAGDEQFRSPLKQVSQRLSISAQALAAGNAMTHRAELRRVYYFDEMIVGTASVAASGWAAHGGGRISLEYCEVLLHAENGTCLRQSGFGEPAPSF